jgi:hypothetical protein
MARDQWQADIKAQRISHKTLNFQVQFEGDPTSDNCEGRPGKFPDGLSALQKVRLVREAFDYYIEAWKQERSSPVRPVSGNAPAASSASASSAASPSSTSPISSGKPRLGLRKASTTD